MWVQMNDGFISIVENRDNKDGVVVRARQPEILKKMFPDNELIVSDDSDYQYRVFAGKAEVAKLVHDRIMGINYDNFKNSVKDKKLANFYHAIWAKGLAYGNGGPLSYKGFFGG